MTTALAYYILLYVIIHVSVTCFRAKSRQERLKYVDLDRRSFSVSFGKRIFKPATFLYAALITTALILILNKLGLSSKL